MKTQTHAEFLKWYETIHEPFVRYCSSRAYGLIETEDLVQETILATLKGFSRIQHKEKLLGFMIGVVNNLIKNKLRRKKFRGQWDEVLLEKLESRAPSPEVALDIHYLLKAMEQLPARQKEALILFEVSGFSLREVAEIQESSVAAVKTRLHRSRQKLRTLLTDEGSTSTSVSARLAAYASILL
ncbi:MAG: RNA polymerase sigma factor [Bacteroidota bacterium]